MLSHWKKYILGCAIGNFLEWYDFALYGLFSPIFARLFFTDQNTSISLLLTFAIFAGGSAIRPFAGILFGYVGDKFGRKCTLVYSIVLITFSTALMGCLPTYESAGVIAPILLLVCRLLQGAAVSGEEVGAVILLAENASKKQQTLMGSIILSSVYAGLFFGTFVTLILFIFSSDAFLYTWGWRLPFLGAIILGIIGLKIRLQALDSRQFTALKQHHAVLKNPIRTLFTQHLKPFFLAIAISAPLAAVGYTFSAYLPSYYMELAKFDHISSLSISAIFFLLIIIAIPLAGLWGDKVGSKKMILAACASLLFFAYPIFWLLAQHVLWMAIVAELILVMLLTFIAACSLSIVINLFPTNIRYSGACTSFNLSMTIFGGTTPMIILLLQNFFQNQAFGCLYLIGVAALAVLALVI